MRRRDEETKRRSPGRKWLHRPPPALRLFFTPSLRLFPPATSPSPSPSSPFSARLSSTTASATSITTTPPHSSSPCAAAIRTPPSTGWRACSSRGKIPASSPGASPSSPARTSETPIHRPSRSPRPLMTWSSSSACPSVSSRLHRPSLIWPAPPRAAPATMPSPKPPPTCATPARCRSPSACATPTTPARKSSDMARRRQAMRTTSASKPPTTARPTADTRPGSPSGWPNSMRSASACRRAKETPTMEPHPPPAGPANKREVRRFLRERLAGLSPQQRHAQSSSIASLVDGLPEWGAARAVMLYLALPDEVDTAELFACAFAEGKTVAVPRIIDPAARSMIPVHIHSLDEQKLQEAHFGIRVPLAEPEEVPIGEIDLVLVPGLGFSRCGDRIGRGLG